MEIVNPTYVGLTCPTLPTIVYFNGTAIATASISPLNLNSGKNSFNSLALVTQDPEIEWDINTFLGEYTSQQEQQVVIRGNPNLTTIEVLKKALSNMNPTAIVPGMPHGLIERIKMDFVFSKILQGIIPTRLTMINPWQVPYEVIGVAVRVYNEGNFIASLSENMSLNPIIVPANSTIESSDMPVQVEGLSLAEIEALLGDILLTIVGELKATMNGFPADVQYTQKNIPASFRST